MNSQKNFLQYSHVSILGVAYIKMDKPVKNLTSVLELKLKKDSDSRSQM